MFNIKKFRGFGVEIVNIYNKKDKEMNEQKITR